MRDKSIIKTGSGPIRPPFQGGGGDARIADAGGFGMMGVKPGTISGGGGDGWGKGGAGLVIDTIPVPCIGGIETVIGGGDPEGP